jgi:Asp-tRNA(Asn)/Glu-tRNA(Gln) amidotransferase A subunit family amidase
MFPEARHVFEGQLLRLRQAGYQVKRVPFLNDGEVDEVYRRTGTLLHAEMAAVHATWFARYEPLYRPRTANAIRRGQATSAADASIARDGRLTFRRAIEDLMARAGVDLWALPASAGGAPKGLETTGWGGMTTPWSYAGLPAITVPAGRDDRDLPLGLQAIAAFGADEHLLTWAHDLADAVRECRDHHEAPRRDPTPIH